jgi:hypothetical protein
MALIKSVWESDSIAILSWESPSAKVENVLVVNLRKQLDAFKNQHMLVFCSVDDSLAS